MDNCNFSILWLLFSGTSMDGLGLFDDSEWDDFLVYYSKKKKLLLPLLMLITRSRSYLTRQQLRLPPHSAWRTLKDERSDLGFISAMGVTVGAFNYLSWLVSTSRQWWEEARHMEPDDLTGIVLYYLHNQCQQASLC
jgi:hypothetical protein